MALKKIQKKTWAILDMWHPASKKEVEQLTCWVAILCLFISKLVEHCLPFFKILCQMNDIAWIEDCKQAFEELKKRLKSSPLLSKPETWEVLYLYLIIALEVISYVLIWLDDKRAQRPIYYTSRVLHDAETKYSKLEKNIYILIISAKHLRS